MTGHALGGLGVLISQTLQVKQAVQTLIVSGTRHLAALRCHVAHFHWFCRGSYFYQHTYLEQGHFSHSPHFRLVSVWLSESYQPCVIASLKGET